MDHLTDAPIANILILAGIVFLAVGLFGRIGGFIGSIFGNIEAGKNSRVLAGVLGLVLVAGGAYLHNDARKSSTATPVVSPVPTPAPIDRSSNQTAPVPPIDKAKPRQLTQASKTKAAPVAKSGPSVPAADREKLPTSSAPSPGDDRFLGTWNNVFSNLADGIKRIEVSRTGQGLQAHIWHFCTSGECDFGAHPLAGSGDFRSYDFTHNDRRLQGTLNSYSPNVVLLSVNILERGTTNHWHHNRVLIPSSLSGELRDALSRYLSAPAEKAFALAPGGTWAYHLRANSASDAEQVALRRCQQHAVHPCRIILLNDAAPE